MEIISDDSIFDQEKSIAIFRLLKTSGYAIVERRGKLTISKKVEMNYSELHVFLGKENCGVMLSRCENNGV